MSEKEPPLNADGDRLADLLKKATEMHRAGKLAPAADFYKKILDIDSRDINALTNLGTIHLQNEHYDEAIRLIGASVAVNPRQPVAFNNLGCAFQDAGRPGEALDSYDRALDLVPDYAEAHYNRGNTLHSLGRLEEAVAAYDRTVALIPEHGEAFSNRGIVLATLERFDEAIDSFDAVIRLYPDYVEAHHNRTSALKELNRNEEALAGYDAILRLTPRDAEIHNNRGNLLREMGRYVDALASYDAALTLRDTIPEIHLNRVSVLLTLGRYDDALLGSERAVALGPEGAAAHFSHGNVLSTLKRYREAVQSYERAFLIDPLHDYLPGNLLHTRQQVCDWTGLEEGFLHLLEGVDAGEKAAAPFALLATPATPAQQTRAAELYRKDKFPLVSQTGRVNPSRYHDRIRIGYFSADFCLHPVAHMIAGLFEAHDRARFEVTGFSLGPPKRDEMRRRLEQAFDHFVDCEKYADSEIAALARDREIDIGVDLNGFTDGARNGVFARRAAPVQVNYIGFPGPSGNGYIDYTIADSIVIPPEYRAGYSEKIAFLPESYLMYDVPRTTGQLFTRAEHGLPESGFVFCCFNNNFKITPSVFDIWMRLLDRLPGSVLWLLAANEASKSNLRSEAERRGIVADRLVFAPRMPLSDHLMRYRCADLSLDTEFYNGHTTTLDSLWAGTPVITCPGRAFASRVAASALLAAGLPDFVTASWEAYEALAFDLATGSDRLLAAKETLSSGARDCSLFDNQTYARGLEAAYARMWERQLRGEAPEDIRVSV